MVPEMISGKYLARPFYRGLERGEMNIKQKVLISVEVAQSRMDGDLRGV